MCVPNVVDVSVTLMTFSLRSFAQNERNMPKVVVAGKKKGKGFASKGAKRSSAKSKREQVRAGDRSTTCFQIVLPKN